jgi:hypothetical protein
MTDTDRENVENLATSDTTAGTEPARLFGLRRSVWVEIALFISVALLLDQSVFQGARYWDVAPHPFWILVVLISAQYGTSEGLVASLAVSAALLTGNLPTQTIDQDFYAYVFEITRLPLMWLVTAVIVGEITNRHLHEREKLLDELRKVTESEEQIALAYTTTKVAKEKLVGQVAGQLRTVLSTLRAVKAVEKLNPGDVLLGAVDLVTQLLGPRKFSLFFRNNNVLEMALQQGWQAGDSYSPAIHATSPLFEMVVGNRRVLCITDAMDEALLNGEGLLAGPLIDAENDEVVGMLKLEDLDYYDLNLVTIENFKAVCDWVATALAHARMFERVAAHSSFALSNDLYSESYFGRHVACLTSLAERVGFPVSLLNLQLEHPENMDPQDLQVVPQALHRAAANYLRTTDLCFERSTGKHSYAIVLAGTALENAQIVVNKLLPALNTELARSKTEARFTIALSEIVAGQTNDARHPENTIEAMERQILLMTRLAHRFQFDLVMVSLRLADAEQMDEVRRTHAGTVIEASLAAGSDSMRLASCYSYSDATVAVLLLAMPEKEARVAADQLVVGASQDLSAAGFESEILAEVRVLMGGHPSTAKLNVVPAAPNRQASRAR